MMLWKLSGAAISVILVPQAVMAHGSASGGLLDGIAHPLTGQDHLFAILAFGIILGGPGLRAALPLGIGFLSAMVAGAFAGAAGFGLPGVEPAILASVIILAALIALAAQPTVPIIAGMAAVFGAAHGLAHGVEAPVGALAPFVMGFALTTAGLLLGGAKIGRWLPAIMLRIVGGALSIFGLGFVLAAV